MGFWERGLTSKTKILLIGNSDTQAQALLERMGDNLDVVTVSHSGSALSRLAEDGFDAVYVCAPHFSELFPAESSVSSDRILETMPDGAALLDSDNKVLWGNRCLQQWSGRDKVAGENFYVLLGNPEILGPDFCPFHTALATCKASGSILRTGENRYFNVHAAPIVEPEGPPRRLVVTVRDVTHEALQQQKLAAIHQAGIELADLMPEELLQMSVEERIELLKSNILHFTKDLLNFDVVEIRLVDQETGRLEPLLSVGILPEASSRVLYAQPQNNGVTGFVAATGKSYLCEDTSEDPLYIEGAKGAKSSLTVPLVLHDVVIGTFNVESPEPRAFTESDLQFLEIFTRDVAIALNTLELLVAEQASTTAKSVEAIHSAVALPVDEILNDAVNIMERYIGHEPEVAEHLHRILRNARDIKQVIQKVGQKMTPSQATPQTLHAAERPALRGRQVLVADADESVRVAAHNLLERYGCIVETAHNAAEAIYMVRNMRSHNGYDAIIADIRLPDLCGYDLLLKLKEITPDHLPLILMTGYGYDPTHSIPNARKAGLPTNWVLYKPFRLDQLLETVELVVNAPRQAMVAAT
jgi:CheY-like chemotaxis protein